MAGGGGFVAAAPVTTRQCRRLYFLSWQMRLTYASLTARDYVTFGSLLSQILLSSVCL